MSDLIEKLEAFQEKSEIYDGCDEDDEIWQDCGKYVLENLPAILSALKTVRGIEGLVKDTGCYGVRIYSPHDGEQKWAISSIAGLSIAETLAAAVEAAGKKGEGR